MIFLRINFKKFVYCLNSIEANRVICQEFCILTVNKLILYYYALVLLAKNVTNAMRSRIV